jgi:hypothetical protein
MPLKKLRRLAAIALPCLALAPLAQAQVFKCVDESGRVVYQQTPCPGAQRGGPVELFLDNGSATEAPEQEARWRAAATQREVLAGMPKRWVQQALGQPAEIRRGNLSDRASEVWRFDTPDGVIRVGFSGNTVAWARSEATAPLGAAGEPAHAAGAAARAPGGAIEPPRARGTAENPEVARSKVTAERNCDDVLAELGPPGRREAVRVPVGAGGVERLADGMRYTYEPVAGGLPVRLAFSCVDGRVAAVSRDIAR